MYGMQKAFFIQKASIKLSRPKANNIFNVHDAKGVKL